MSTPQTTTNTGAARGATITTVYAERQLKAIPVFEVEINILSSLNDQAIAFTSLGSAFVSYAFAIWANAIFATSLTPAGELAKTFGTPALLVTAAVFYWLANDARKKRKRLLTEIKEQSKSETKQGIP